MVDAEQVPSVPPVLPVAPGSGSRGPSDDPSAAPGAGRASDPGCVVCRIVAGELEAQVVHRDDTLIAFLDHRPVFPGHVLVCPLQHVPDLFHLDTGLMEPLLAMAQRMSRAQQQALDAHGSFVALNNVVSQSVPHVHVHVVPRRFKDGLRGFFWPRTKYAPGQDADIAARLRLALESDGA